jgi:Chlorite dismutase
MPFRNWFVLPVSATFPDYPSGSGLQVSLGCVPSPLPVRFIAGTIGSWKIERIDEVRGETLPAAARLEVVEGRADDRAPGVTAWVLRGVTSNERYVTRAERDELEAVQEGLGRPASTKAALIPIKKSAEWWHLSQDERRTIFEETSQHVRTGLKYLPAVARRLHHSRDLGEPFDFLTWFEYAPEDAEGFEELVAILRRTEGWRYVEREVDIRVGR